MSELKKSYFPMPQQMLKQFKRKKTNTPSKKTPTTKPQNDHHFIG